VNPLFYRLGGDVKVGWLYFIGGVGPGRENLSYFCCLVVGYGLRFGGLEMMVLYLVWYRLFFISLESICRL